MTSTMTPTRSERVTHGQPVARLAAGIAAGMLAGLIMFQVALAAGAPLGRVAWGGTHNTLPTSLRLATTVPIAIYALGALILLRHAGYSVGRFSPTIARRGTLVFAVVLTLSALANFASHSEWEGFLMGPTALTLAALSIIIARGGVAS
jgi:hypothetical protein